MQLFNHTLYKKNQIINKTSCNICRNMVMNIIIQSYKGKIIDGEVI